jgi:hypothetical protein
MIDRLLRRLPRRTIRLMAIFVAGLAAIVFVKVVMDLVFWIPSVSAWLNSPAF